MRSLSLKPQQYAVQLQQRCLQTQQSMMRHNTQTRAAAAPDLMCRFAWMLVLQVAVISWVFLR